jgi:hypothetical protein
VILVNSTSLFSFHFNKKGRKRAAVSPVIATTILLGITVTVGLALWSFANSGVGSATQQYADIVTDYGNFASDRFVIANIDFNNPDTGDVAFWIYNSGKFPTTINNVVLTCRDCSAAFDPDPDLALTLTQYAPYDLGNRLTMDTKTLKKFSFDSGTNIEALKTYELTVVSETGASQSYVKRSD